MKKLSLLFFALMAAFVVSAQDFTIDLTASEPTLPTGVTQESYPSNGAAYHGNQHGWQWFAFTFQAEGPVKITLGGCQYINTGYEGYVMAGSTKLGDIANKTEGCYDAAPATNIASYEYTGEAAALTVYCGQYCPYVKVETVEALAPAAPFVDFTVDLTQNPVVLPEGVRQASYPDHGVSYNGASHGWCWYAAKFHVDGPVKITLGGCQFAAENSASVYSDAAAETLATLNTKTAACWHQDPEANVVTYDYMGGADSLTVFCGQYCPYLKVEKIFVFTDFTVDLTQNPVVLPEGVRQASYPDHGVSFNGASHGWCWYAAKFRVDGPVKITLGGCQYAAENSASVYSDANAETLATLNTKTAACWHQDPATNIVTYEYTGGEDSLTVFCGQYCPYLKVEKLTIVIPTIEMPDVTEDPEMTQVWDFGAQQFTGVQNMLSVDEMNSWYAETVTPGTSGIAIGNIAASDSVNFIFWYNNKQNARLRTSNTAISRYDSKTQQSPDGSVTYTGYLYSNSSSTADVYVKQHFSANDKVTYVLGSNSNAATYHFVNAEAEYDATFEFTQTGKVEEATFYIPADGDYKLYCANEKLVLARITRVPCTYVAVSGDITAPAGMPDVYLLRFTSVETGSVQDCAPRSGHYDVVLASGYHYNVSLVDANGFMVSTELPFLVNGTTAQDLTIESVAQSVVSGQITGLPDFKKASFTFAVPEGKVYVPELTVDKATGNFTLVVETGVKYGITVDGVNDYYLTIDSIEASADRTEDLAFALKAQHKLTIVPTGATLEDLAAAKFVFTNINEEGYVYNFVGPDDINLRDGVYSVMVLNTGDFGQMLTSNAKVLGNDTTKQIDFESGFSAWSFNETGFTQGGYTTPTVECNYHGLHFVGGQVNKTYLLMNGTGVVAIPVTGDCQILVSSCYEAHMVAHGDTLRNVKSGSTSQIDVDTINYVGGAGYDTLTTCGTTYLTAINVVYPAAAYQATLTVGEGKEYASIMEALAAVRQMYRPNSERVTLMIEPGNYEEMPTVDVANVTFRNASATPSIAVADAGVSIDENAVRITGYYGHGYNYYSMDNNYGWDARTLQVNKENGYASIKNVGGAPARKWNSTVLVLAPGFEAYDIIFENSYNQYVSQKEADDVVIDNGAGKGARPTTALSTAVQQKKFVERASAIGFGASADRTYLKNCRFIGHQDVVYGDQGARVAVDGGILQGGTDYIFGGMIFVAYKADIVINVESDKNDVAYITAAKNDASQPRGYLFANCHVRSVEPLVEMACATYAKPAYWGRPWDSHAETIFLGTAIDSTRCTGYSGSMIAAAGWNDGLVSMGSQTSYEGFSFEQAANPVVNSRVAWAHWLTASSEVEGVTVATLPDSTPITLFGWTRGSDNWDPFNSAVIDLTTNPYAVVDPTAVENVETGELVRKLIIDGMLLIEKDGVLYTTMGQVVR